MHDELDEYLTDEEKLDLKYKDLLRAPCSQPNYFDVGQAIVTGQCRNTFSAKCPSCAARFLRNVRLRVHSGFESVLDADAESGHFWFVTLTAPGFGARVHNIKPDGCCSVCRATHSKSDPLIGYPRSNKHYDFASAVQWNYLAPRLWNGFITRLRRSLPDLRIEYFTGVEHQSRQSVHFHSIIKVVGDVSDDDRSKIESQISRVVSVVSVTPSTDVAKAFDRNRSVRFGRESDVQYMGSSESPLVDTKNATVAYITKTVVAYASKDFSETYNGVPSKMSKSMRRHSTKYLSRLGVDPSVSGYKGRRYFFSRGWGISANELSLRLLHRGLIHEKKLSAESTLADVDAYRNSGDNAERVRYDDCMTSMKMFVPVDGKRAILHDRTRGTELHDEIEQLRGAVYGNHQ